MNIRTTASKLALAVTLSISATAAFAQADNSGYWVDSSKSLVWKNSTGLCWRAGYWTPAMANAECDADLLPKPAPAPVAAAPAPAPVPAPAPKPITIAAKSLFDFNKAVLKPGAKDVIDAEVVSKLAQFGTVQTVIVSGHTDRIGSAQYNQKLSEKRAEAVKAYLVTKGIKAEQIETYGYGKTQPLPEVKCDDKLPRKKLISCLEPNRRVTVEVKGAGK